MMDVHQKQSELWVEPVNLARRVPEDHLLRKLTRQLDLSFVREAVSKSYGRNGHVSLDPVIIMKMLLLLFLDNIRSERELMRIIPLRIDYLWYLGYGLEDETPNHSVLSKARKRWGAEVFEQLFKETVRKCLEAGLIDGSKVHVDSSDIRANASKNSVVEIACQEMINKLEEPDEAKGGGGSDKNSGGVNRTHWNTRRNYAEYEANASECARCELRPQCTRAKTGRTVNRRIEQALLDEARAQSASEAGKEDRKRRQHFQERNFADAANLHGYKRSRWRGLVRQRVQDYLICALQNLRLLVRRSEKDAFTAISALTEDFIEVILVLANLFDTHHRHPAAGMTSAKKFAAFAMRLDNGSFGQQALKS